MISQDTFETAFHRQLLDLLYGQWAILGSPLSNLGEPSEVIDPEALLCCSLEFLPTEPRLAEAVREWVAANQDYLVRQRVYKLLNDSDPRAVIWHALDAKARPSLTQSELPTETCYGLSDPQEAVDFALSLAATTKPSRTAPPRRIGRKQDATATLILRARDVLGHDIRHFLLVYLLALPHGGKIRDIQSWSGHAYRSLSDVADRWQEAGIVSVDSGFCRLLTPEPFRALLKVRSEQIVLVNWLTVFETSVRLLRDLAKARSKGFAANGPIPTALRREAIERLELASSSPASALSDTSIRHLLRTFPTLVA